MWMLYGISDVKEAVSAMQIYAYYSEGGSVMDRLVQNRKSSP